MSDDSADRRPDEFPDRAGYPDGTGSLDEGTGAFGGADLGDLEEFAMEDEEDEDGNV
ncbi:hypothetical protein P5G50_02085 [Leifsonia sp. F6_8S_P_1B]|uniref:Uncharacterized protein n=1 Tax=Leifsonia williamsii TaxID=3035919 RepID=A0ABT8KA80_9MICO|nr:hypothetical protein [Leifsonia williamsii]MDN4613229.1 hypothetical protein [Leifsonia williamsii]